jgi:hypothetical protein
LAPAQAATAVAIYPHTGLVTDGGGRCVEQHVDAADEARALGGVLAAHFVHQLDNDQLQDVPEVLDLRWSEWPSAPHDWWNNRSSKRSKLNYLNKGK